MKELDKATLNSNLHPPWRTCPLCLHLWARQAQVIDTHSDLFRPLYMPRMSQRLWSKNQQNRLFVMSMLWAGAKRFHLQPGRYKIKKQTTSKTNPTFQGSKPNSVSEWMTEVNRLTGIGSLYCLGTAKTSGSWRISDLTSWWGLGCRSGLWQSINGSVVNWVHCCIPQWLTGQSGSDRKRKSELVHAHEHKDNNVPHSFHSPLVFFSWCVLREVPLQIQKV